MPTPCGPNGQFIAHQTSVVAFDGVNINSDHPGFSSHFANSVPELRKFYQYSLINKGKQDLVKSGKNSNAYAAGEVAGLDPNYIFKNQTERRHVTAAWNKNLNTEFRDKEKARGLYDPKNTPQWWPKHIVYCSPTNKSKNGEDGKHSCDELDELLSIMREEMLKMLDAEFNTLTPGQLAEVQKVQFSKETTDKIEGRQKTRARARPQPREALVSQESPSLQLMQPSEAAHETEPETLQELTQMLENSMPADLMMSDDVTPVTTVAQQQQQQLQLFDGAQIVQIEGKYWLIKYVTNTDGQHLIQPLREATPDEVQMHFQHQQQQLQLQLPQQQVLVTQDGENTSMQPRDAAMTSPVHAVDGIDNPAKALPATLDALADYPIAAPEDAPWKQPKSEQRAPQQPEADNTQLLLDNLDPKSAQQLENCVKLVMRSPAHRGLLDGIIQPRQPQAAAADVSSDVMESTSDEIARIKEGLKRSADDSEMHEMQPAAKMTSAMMMTSWQPIDTDEMMMTFGQGHGQGQTPAGGHDDPLMLINSINHGLAELGASTTMSEGILAFDFTSGNPVMYSGTVAQPTNTVFSNPDPPPPPFQAVPAQAAMTSAASYTQVVEAGAPLYNDVMMPGPGVYNDDDMEL